jgi:hypothetical protein
LTLFCITPLELNQRGFFFFDFDGHGDVTSADRTLKPSPVSPALKMSVYDRATLGALGIGVAVIRIIFGQILSFLHTRLLKVVWSASLPDEQREIEEPD